MYATALITGITGQDGFYLATELLNSNTRVIGTTRDTEKARVKLGSLYDEVELVSWDMADSRAFLNLLMEFAPTHIYNLGALSSGEFMDSNPESVMHVNGIAVLRMLEAIKIADPTIRFCQASSSEVFAGSGVTPQNELTPRVPRSIYGAAKIFADNVVSVYRKKFGLHACSAFLFNHESPRRGDGFVTQKVIRGAVDIKLKHQSKLKLGNLSAARDWGFAGDYMEALTLMLAREEPSDYVLATGITHTVEDLCELVFSLLELDYRDYVDVEPAFFRPEETALIVGDSEMARRELNWAPKVNFRNLIEMMLDNALSEKMTR